MDHMMEIERERDHWFQMETEREREMDHWMRNDLEDELKMPMESIDKIWKEADTDTDTETETEPESEARLRRKKERSKNERSRDENIFRLWLPSYLETRELEEAHLKRARMAGELALANVPIGSKLVMSSILPLRSGPLSSSVAVWKAWERSEMDRFMELWRFVCHMKVSELEINYVKKKKLKALKESGERVLQVDLEDTRLMKFYSRYMEFRKRWKRRYYNCGEFEDITSIRCMYYTEGNLPRFVLQCPQPVTLQIFSARIGQRHSDWPLQVYGLIAVRDFVDAHRIVIFNRYRDECQILTKEDPYLHLTGPTRSPVINMNEKMGPVSIEAELKVKGAVESEDKYIILQAMHFLNPMIDTVELHGPHMKLQILLGAIWKSVEATIFIRVIDGTWPTGFHGQFSAFTASQKLRKVILLEYNGDGKMEQSRYVMSVDASGMLVVTFKAWKGEEVIKENLSFDAVSRGRSIAAVKLGPCTMEVLVAWSLVHPYCEELVPSEWQSLCNF